MPSNIFAVSWTQHRKHLNFTFARWIPAGHKHSTFTDLCRRRSEMDKSTGYANYPGAQNCIRNYILASDRFIFPLAPPRYTYESYGSWLLNETPHQPTKTFATSERTSDLFNDQTTNKLKTRRPKCFYKYDVFSPLFHVAAASQRRAAVHSGYSVRSFSLLILRWLYSEWM